VPRGGKCHFGANIARSLGSRPRVVARSVLRWRNPDG